MYIALNILYVLNYVYVIAIVALMFILFRKQGNIEKYVLFANTALVVVAGGFVMWGLYIMYCSKDVIDPFPGFPINDFLSRNWFVNWGLIIFHGLAPQVLWIRRLRRSVWMSIAIVPVLLFNLYEDYLISLMETKWGQPPAVSPLQIIIVLVVYLVVLSGIVLFIQKRMVNESNLS